MQLTVNLEDLVPQEATFELSSRPGEKFVLKPYTLRMQTWAAKKFGPAVLEKAFTPQGDALVLAEIAFEAMKDKTQFKALDDLLEAVVTFSDRAALVNALFTTVGMSQPVLDKYTKQLEEKQAAAQGNAASPAAESAGQNSST